MPNYNLRSTSQDRHPWNAFTPRKARTKIKERDIHNFKITKVLLVTKGSQFLALIKNAKGQISIFFSASLIVLVTIIAFVINIGLFVKAKINLQNATDAAAFAGAAVQARQLTKIAYLNWEMRNIYKEWMYKYYVVGNINSPMVQDTDPSQISNSDPMSFRLKADNDIITGNTTVDPFNIPAVCIHLANQDTNICQRYAIPGLPEFGGYSIPGSEEASRAFIDSLIGAKVDNCNQRSMLNMNVATTWAYNVLTDPNASGDTLAGRGPAILTDRQGAWPRAMEVGMRIRNLEKVVNRPAQTERVCKSSSSATGCSLSIDTISSANLLGNERIVKAFYSGYRNLGNEIDNEMKESFTLTEIPPMVAGVKPAADNSNYLIPNSEIYPKQYLDLKLMTLNLTTFFAAMFPRAGKRASAACDIAKVAIPVPGYPLGFYKNPQVLTYYAVRGEAEFVGMFNPFSADSIKLTAYAAAKPMGGRIGPMLFTQGAGSDIIVARSDKLRSVPYIATLNTIGAPVRDLKDPSKKIALDGNSYGAGAPLPINFTGDKFWIENPTDAVGGYANQEVKFGIPNLVYDFTDGSFDPSSYNKGADPLNTITPANGTAGDEAIGLFNRGQFAAFKGDLPATITPENLLDEVMRVRAATLYESANYLIPTPHEINMNFDVDSFGFQASRGKTLSNGTITHQAYLYAPLFKGLDSDQEDILYKSTGDVKSGFEQLMLQQEKGIEYYLYALNRAAKFVYDMSSNNQVIAATAEGSAPAYVRAADSISDIDFSDPDIRQTEVKSCKSLAGQFLFFYYGNKSSLKVKDVSSCPRPLHQLIEEYYSSGSKDPNFSSSHYMMEYSYNPRNFSKSPNGARGIFSAYMPGPFTGAEADGKLTGAFSGISDENMQRNFYSTKFVSLDSLMQGGGYEIDNMVKYSEGAININAQNITEKIENPINPSGINADLSKVKH